METWEQERINNTMQATHMSTHDRAPQQLKTGMAYKTSMQRGLCAAARTPQRAHDKVGHTLTPVGHWCGPLVWTTGPTLTKHSHLHDVQHDLGAREPAQRKARDAQSINQGVDTAPYPTPQAPPPTHNHHDTSADMQPATIRLDASSAYMRPTHPSGQAATWHTSTRDSPTT